MGCIAASKIPGVIIHISPVSVSHQLFLFSLKTFMMDAELCSLISAY